MYLKKRETTGDNARSQLCHHVFKETRDNERQQRETMREHNLWNYVIADNGRQRETPGNHKTTGDNGRQCENTIYAIMLLETTGDNGRQRKTRETIQNTNYIL